MTRWRSRESYEADHILGTIWKNSLATYTSSKIEVDRVQLRKIQSLKKEQYVKSRAVYREK
jgi:hypothetical protein